MATRIETRQWLYVELDDNSDDEIQVRIEWVVSGEDRPARVFGRPEHCYEGESRLYEIERITVRAFGRTYDVREAEVTALISIEELEENAKAEYGSSEPDFESMIADRG